MMKLTPEDLMKQENFELLAEVEHQNIKQFILSQISPGINLIRWFSNYQIAMMLLFVFLIIKAVIRVTRGMDEALWQIGYALLFSFTVLILLHEMIHALAYLSCGAKHLKAGIIWRKFIFYVMADRQVMDSRSFRLVACAPFVLVKGCCLILGLVFWSTSYAYFFFGVMCIHSLFCAGDMAMLAFYDLHAGKEIFNFDDRDQGKTFFYYRRSR